MSNCPVSNCPSTMWEQAEWCKTVARCKLHDLCNITHDFVVISKHCTFTSTFEK